MEERRQFVRLDTRLEASCTTLPGGKVQRIVTKDISGGGVCVFTDQVLSPGTQLQVAMTLPGREEPINFIAQVVWSEPYEVIGKSERRRAVETGVRFIEISPKDQAAIMQHVILSLQPQQPPPQPPASS